MSNRVYASATEHINKHPYDVLIPLSYGRIPDAVADGTFHPIHDDNDPKALYRSRLPIANFIDMHHTKVTFQYIKDEDILEIQHMLDAYLEEVSVSAMTNEAVTNYIKKVIPYRAEHNKCFLKCLNRHPDWKRQYKESDKISTLLDIFTNAHTIKPITTPNYIDTSSSNLGYSGQPMDGRSLMEQLKGIKYDE